MTVTTVCVIRPPEAGELELLPVVHSDSRELFVDVGVSENCALPIVEVPSLSRALVAGGLLIAAFEDDVVGFGVFETVDDDAYLRQLSVRPSHGGRGVGSTLLEALVIRGKETGHRAMTLLTYRQVPWNQPFYERHAFEALPPEALAPYLVAYLAEEESCGIDVARRVAMRRELAGSGRVGGSAS